MSRAAPLVTIGPTSRPRGCGASPSVGLHGVPRRSALHLRWLWLWLYSTALPVASITTALASPCSQATDAASFKFVVKVPMGAFPGEVIGVIKVNGKPYGSVTVPPGSKPGKRLKMQVPHPPGSKVSFDYSAAYVPPGEGSRVSPAAPVAVRCAGEKRWTGSAC